MPETTHDAGYEADDEADDEDAFRAAYDDTRHYHLTSAAGKASIRAHGFDRSKKSGNSAAAAGLDSAAADECNAFHYVASTRPGSGSEVTQSDRDNARRFPRVVTRAHGNSHPKVVRVMVDPATLSPDDFFPGQPAFKMGNQPADAVLQAHGNEPLARAVEVYRLNAQRRLGRHVSTGEAKNKLMEYQSDSANDTDV